MEVLKGDFIGFTFNDKHSSELGIVRTSDGSRFNENLLPVYSDKTVVVPGEDGTYYFGSNFTQRVFDIPIAFDSLTEKQFRDLRGIFGDKKIHNLIFDEAPYKVYQARINENPSLKYICFDEDGERVYKGEGTISLICYYPFGKSRYKYLEDYTSDNIPEWDTEYGNLDEWIVASGIKNKGTYDTFSNRRYNLYNPGDMETDYLLTFDFPEDSSTIKGFQIFIVDDEESQLNFGEITKISSDAGFRINSKLNLIEGLDSQGRITGTIYNRFKTSGNFFKIPQGESSLSITGTLVPKEMKYDFIYF